MRAYIDDVCDPISDKKTLFSDILVRSLYNVYIRSRLCWMSCEIFTMNNSSRLETTTSISPRIAEVTTSQDERSASRARNAG